MFHMPIQISISVSSSEINRHRDRKSFQNRITNGVNVKYWIIRDRSDIMVCQVKVGAKILPAYSRLDIRVKQQTSIWRKCKPVCN